MHDWRFVKDFGGDVKFPTSTYRRGAILYMNNPCYSSPLGSFIPSNMHLEDHWRVLPQSTKMGVSETQWRTHLNLVVVKDEGFWEKFKYFCWPSWMWCWRPSIVARACRKTYAFLVSQITQSLLTEFESKPSHPSVPMKLGIFVISQLANEVDEWSLLVFTWFWVSQLPPVQGGKN